MGTRTKTHQFLQRGEELELLTMFVLMSGPSVPSVLVDCLENVSKAPFLGSVVKKTLGATPSFNVQVRGLALKGWEEPVLAQYTQ